MPSKEMSLYPNPAADMLNITFKGEQGLGSQVTIYNQSGQLVRSLQVSKSTVQVDIRSLKGGMYYVRSGTGRGVKFLKSR